MKIYRANWYYVGLIIFIVLSFAMGFFGNRISLIQVILVFSYMALLIHQLEEYGLPGGFPWIFNIVMNGEKETPDRFPQNSNLAMLVNVPFAYTFYLLAIIFPDVIWLGLATMFFGLFQILFHSIVINIRIKSFYSPGMASCIFLHGPVGVYYIWYVVVHGLTTMGDFIWGFAGMVVAAIIMVALPIRLFSNRNTKYPFSQIEMHRFGTDEKLKQLELSKPLFGLFQKK